MFKNVLIIYNICKIFINIFISLGKLTSRLFIYLEIVVATNDVWNEISIFLNGAISKNALHVFVHRGRHGIKTELGIINERDENDANLVKGTPNEIYDSQRDSG